MTLDILDLRSFYQSSEGAMARRLLRAHLHKLWPNVGGEHIAAVGYGTPLLRPWLGQSKLYAFMPAAQGVAYWPREGPNCSTLIETDRLPAANSSLDRILIVHALETLAEPAPLLREIWRALKGSGRLLIIVPNRLGIWAHSDKTPFGHGQPYSVMQIRNLLHNHGFMIERQYSALYPPPHASQLTISLSERIERISARIFPGFGGVLVIEASKQIYAPRTEKQGFRHRLVLPLPMNATHGTALPRS